LAQSEGSILALKDDLEAEVKKIFREVWTERDGTVVPEPKDLKLGNDAVNLEATVLYADMSGSTHLVDTHTPKFAAEIYKTYLVCAARIIKHQGGTVTAYDGDRIMAVYLGDSKNTNAVRSALKINGAVWDIIKPALKNQYSNTDYNLKHVIGVDTSKLLVARIGVRNDNDLVWVGRAANYAAKLSALSDDVTIRITGSVHDTMNESVKLGGVLKTNMWEERIWTAMNNMKMYGTTWKFGV
jgi:class 3 adenylate cyclase